MDTTEYESAINPDDSTFLLTGGRCIFLSVHSLLVQERVHGEPEHCGEDGEHLQLPGHPWDGAQDAFCSL